VNGGEAGIRDSGFVTVEDRVAQEEPVHIAGTSQIERPSIDGPLTPEHVDGMAVTRRLADEELQANLPMDLEQLRDVLRRNRVNRAWLFGSRSRGDHRIDSDIDLLYEPKGDKLQLREYGRLVNALDDVSPVPVDLADEIVDRIKPYIENDLVRVL
jgi:predicted nucleotidyltransferase